MHKRMVIVIGTLALFLAAFAQNARAHDEPVVGSLVGAGIGAAIGGPPGAAVGAVIGAAFGSHAAHETDHGKHAHRHRHARYVGRVRHEHVGHVHHERGYATPARYAYANGNGNGGYSDANCEPRVVYRDARPARPVKVVERTTMKRVCKRVPVKQHVVMR